MFWLIGLINPFAASGGEFPTIKSVGKRTVEKVKSALDTNIFEG